MDRAPEAAEVLDRLRVLEPGFSVREAMVRSPLSRPEDVVRYAEGLRRAGLPEEDDVLQARRPSLAIQYSLIDLAPEAPHTLKFDAESTA
jgi:hypothetical protein